MAFKDRRRTDARDQIQGRPVVFTSAEISVADVAAGTTVLLSFPNPNETYILTRCSLDVLTDLNGGTVNIGHGSLPLDSTAESGTLTTTTADSLWPSATGDETSGTIFSTYSLSTAGSLEPVILVGAASTVPVVLATIATAVTGIFRIHLEYTAIPSYT